MYKKYRIIIFTIKGRLLAASSDSVNGLADDVKYWLLNTPAGRSVYDDQVRAVAIYQYDFATGQYVNVGQVPARNRREVIAQVRLLGAR